MGASKDDIIRLIGLAYKAVDEVGGWDLFMAELMRTANFQAAGLTVRRGMREHFEFTSTYGMNDKSLEDFKERVADVNPFQPHADQQALGYTTRAASSLIPRREWTATEFFDWMARMQTSDVVFSLEKMTEGRMVSFNGFTPAGTLIEDAHVELVRTLVPHMFHAVSLSHQIQRLQAERNLSREALSRADFGCVFFDRHARVDWMNDHASTLLKRDDVFELDGDELRARHSGSQTLLKAALEAALRVSDGQLDDIAPILKMERLGEGHPVEVLISPTQPFSHRLFGPSRGAMLLMADPEHVDESFAERLGGLYGLTPTEAEVAQWLLSGASTNDIARIFDRSIHTIRAHVKRLLMKCGASSKAELIGMLQRSLARLA